MLPSQTVTCHLNQNEPVLQSHMDLFSLGCIIAELFSEDSSNGNLFTLAELLEYRQQQYYPTKVIDSIPDMRIREIVVNLIDLNPDNRRSTFYHLTNLMPEVFPNYFTFLFDYLGGLIRLPPDAKIIRLQEDLDGILKIILREDPHGLLLLLTTITSSLRALKHAHCKIVAQRLGVKLVSASPLMSGFILERFLPYLMSSLSDSDSKVRAEAICSIKNSLELVTEVSGSDNNVFTDYILPVLVSFNN